MVGSSSLPKSTSSSSAQSLYFLNAPTDALLVGGLSLLAFALMGLVQHVQGPRAHWLWGIAALAWLCNWPHFAATNYRLYHSRETIAQYPLTAFLVPLVMAAGAWASLASPQLVAPFFVKLFLLWSPYHYSGQAVGITLLYARRGDIRIGPWPRRALAGFIFGTFLFNMARVEATLSPITYYSLKVPTLGLPAWVATVTGASMAACGAGFLVWAAAWSVRHRRLLPPILFVPALAQFVWFVVGGRVPSFFGFVPFFHGLQYLLIAWSMQLGETLGSGGTPPAPRAVLGLSLRWGAWVFAGGIALFWLLPRLVAGRGVTLDVVEPVVIAAVQMHHFFVDGVIWKLRHARVRSPLLINLDALVRGRPSAEAA